MLDTAARSSGDDLCKTVGARIHSPRTARILCLLETFYIKKQCLTNKLEGVFLSHNGDGAHASSTISNPNRRRVRRHPAPKLTLKRRAPRRNKTKLLHLYPPTAPVSKRQLQRQRSMAYNLSWRGIAIIQLANSL